MQKHNNISTSTDFLPTTICTDCNSLEHPGSNAYVDSAQPRNTGAKMIITLVIIKSYYLEFGIIKQLIPSNVAITKFLAT